MNIAFATPADRDDLATLYLALLESLDKQGFYMLPTQRNAEHFTDHVFLPAAARGEPVLIARMHEAPGGLLGAIFWTGDNSGLDTRYQAAVGHGTYVIPAARGQKVSSQLRRVAIEILREQGYDCVLGGHQVHHRESRRISRALGFKVFATCDRLDIRDVPVLKLG